MKQCLIDTNICIFYIKGLYNLKQKFQQVGNENCLISEVTLAELKFGVENSQQKEKNTLILSNFLSGIVIIPIFSAIETYAKEKARLRKSGQLIDDFDLLIASTAVANDLIMVTNNNVHLGRVNGIKIEDWTKI